MKSDTLGRKVIVIVLLAMMLITASSAASENMSRNTESFQTDAYKRLTPLTINPLIDISELNKTYKMPLDNLSHIYSYSHDERTIESLKFAKPKDIAMLNLKGIERVEYPDKKVKALNFHVNASECSIHPVFGAYVYVKVGDLQPYTAPGEPQLPMKTFVVRLSKNADVQGVKTVSGEYLPIENELKIVPVPQPYIWNSNSEYRKAGEFIPNEEVYALDEYFPGKVLSYDIGCDNEYKYVFVRVYPLQYIPAKKKAVLINDLTIHIYYSEGSESFRTESNFTAKTNTESVIITPASLYDSAIALANFHNESGMTTTVITTEKISSDYTAATDPSYPGYKEMHPGKGNIIGYKYELAKRIITYLRDSTAHPNLKYVTILGNAKLVPPSYYYFDEEYYTSSPNDLYNPWVPTDFFYASPDYDFVANYKIGRIPVNDLAQATSVVSKIGNWYDNVDYTWFKNVALAGGRPFNTEVFVGEMATTDVVNRGYLDGMDVEKCFRTDNRFNNVTFKNALSNTGFVYHIGHGSGDSWCLEESPLDVNDLKNLPANSKVPIVVSVACMNGAYDTNVMQPPWDETVSIGEAVLLSNGGGVSYIGGSRVNCGGPAFYLDFGYVTIVKESHMVGILTNVFKAYHGGKHVLGDLTANATHTFFMENDLEQAGNKRALFEFVLLGDPALKIPGQQPGVSYWQPTLIPEDPLKYYPSEGKRPLNSPEHAATITATTNSPQVGVKIIEITSPYSENVQTTQKKPVNNRLSFGYTAEEINYLSRVISADEKEGWLYSTTAYPVILSKNVQLTINGIPYAFPALFLTDDGDNFPATGKLGECAEWDSPGLWATYQGFDANILPVIFIINPFSGMGGQATRNCIISIGTENYYTMCLDPSYSRDGRYIVHVMRAINVNNTNDYLDFLHAVDFENFDPINKPFGTEIPNTNPGVNLLYEPAYLPDGRIVYCSYNMLDQRGSQGGDATGIYVINRDGTGKSKIVDVSDMPSGFYYLFAALTVSPDGSTIAYVVMWYDYSAYQWYPGIYVVSADGSDAPGNFIYDTIGIRGLDFTPDGTKLIFSEAGAVSDGKLAEWDLWMINVDGTGLTQVTTDKNSFSPAWGTIDILGTNPPTTDFGYSVSDATVQFTDKSTDLDGNIVALSWDFGDGYRSNEQNPVHTYTTSGTYSVTLIAMDNCGAADSMMKHVEVTVAEPYPDWDVNRDGNVNVLDMVQVEQRWGETGAPHWIREDVNRDGSVNVLDMILIGQHWTG